MREYISNFSIERIRSSQPIFDLEKLKWLNGLYIRDKSSSEIESLLVPFFPKGAKKEIIKKIIPLVHDRIHILYDELFEDLFPPFDYTAGFFADIYRQMDFVMGMRGQSNTIAFGQNTPCIALGHHNETIWSLESTYLDRLIIDLNGNAQHIYGSICNSICDVMDNMDDYKNKLSFNLEAQGFIKDNYVSRIIKLLKK